MVGDKLSHRKEIKFYSNLVSSFNFTDGTRVTMCGTFVGQPDARYVLKNLDTEGPAGFTH